MNTIWWVIIAIVVVWFFAWLISRCFYKRRDRLPLFDSDTDISDFTDIFDPD